MRIELENLENGRGAFAHTYPSDELGLVDDRITLKRAATVTGNIKRDATSVVVRGTVNTEVELECDRCLKRLDLPIAVTFKLDYVTAGAFETSHAAELTSDEMAVSTFDGESIDVDEIVREQILLAVPDRMLCQENCKGICPTCGADLNGGDCQCESTAVDPRWEALRKFKSGS